MFLCASQFGWTPDQVKQLSAQELEAIAEAGEKMIPQKPGIQIQSLEPKAAGTKFSVVPDSIPSSVEEIQRFMQKRGQIKKR